MTFKFLSLVILFVSFKGVAQYGGCYSPESLREKFLETTTLVLLTGNEEYDANFKKGLEEYWTLTEYEFVDRNGLNSRVFDNNYSYIKPYNMKVADQYGGQSFATLGLFLAGDSGVGMYENLVAYTYMDVFGDELKVVNGAYRAKHMAKFLHNFVQLRIDEKIIASCAGIPGRMKDYFNQSNEIVKQKTLLVNENIRKDIDEKTFADLYQGRFEFVSAEEIEEAINEEDEETCYLLTLFSYHKYVYVVECSSGDIVYEGYTIRGLELKTKDIKKLGLIK